MGFEKRRLIHRVTTKEELRAARKAAETAEDWTHASPLPRPGLKSDVDMPVNVPNPYSPSGSITYDVPGVALSGPRGEHLHEIAAQKHPQTQYAVSMILKGIIPVADVHAEDWPVSSLLPFLRRRKYYSYDRSHDTRRVEHDHSLAEIEADLLVLRTVFDDDDHSIETMLDPGYGERPDRVRQHVINMHASERFSRAYFYDFHLAHECAMRPFDFERAFARLGCSRETLHFYTEKLLALSQRFEGEEGKRHMRAILVKAAGGTSSRALRRLFARFPDSDSFYRAFTTHLQRLRSDALAWAEAHPHLLTEQTYVEERYREQKAALDEVRSGVGTRVSGGHTQE